MKQDNNSLSLPDKIEKNETKREKQFIVCRGHTWKKYLFSFSKGGARKTRTKKLISGQFVAAAAEFAKYPRQKGETDKLSLWIAEQNRKVILVFGILLVPKK